MQMLQFLTYFNKFKVLKGKSRKAKRHYRKSRKQLSASVFFLVFTLIEHLIAGY